MVGKIVAAAVSSHDPATVRQPSAADGQRHRRGTVTAPRSGSQARRGSSRAQAAPVGWVTCRGNRRPTIQPLPPQRLRVLIGREIVAGTVTAPRLADVEPTGAARIVAARLLAVTKDDRADDPHRSPPASRDGQGQGRGDPREVAQKLRAHDGHPPHALNPSASAW